MSLVYNVKKSTTEPTNPQNCLIWINPDVSFAAIYINGVWCEFASDNVITLYTEETATLTIAAQAAAPTATIGQIWIDTDINQTYIYLTQWIPSLSK